MKSAFLFLFILWSSFCSIGQSWLPLNSNNSSNFLSVHFTDTDNGCAVGQGGTIIRTTDGGITWNSISSSVNTELFDIHFISTDTGYIVGRDGVILKTIDAGVTWNLVASLTSVDLTSINAVGTDLFVTGYNGTMLKSSDGGVSWMPLNTGTNNYLYDVYFINPNSGYAVGYPGTIIATTDGGVTWTPQTSGYTEHLISVFFTDSNNGYITGGDLINGTNSGVILKTTDGGQNWSQFPVVDNYLTKVQFLNANTGYVFGGNQAANTSTILKTTDSGVSWQTESSSSSRQYGGSIPGSGVGYSCGLNGTILKSTNIPLTQGNGINEQLLYSLYPNPGNGSITIQSNHSISKVEITNALGKRIHFGDVHFGHSTLDISKYAHGVYFASFIDTAGKVLAVRKLIIN